MTVRAWGSICRKSGRARGRALSAQIDCSHLTGEGRNFMQWSMSAIAEGHSLGWL